MKKPEIATFICIDVDESSIGKEYTLILEACKLIIIDDVRDEAIQINDIWYTPTIEEVTLKLLDIYPFALHKKTYSNCRLASVGEYVKRGTSIILSFHPTFTERVLEPSKYNLTENINSLSEFDIEYCEFYFSGIVSKNDIVLIGKTKC